MSLISLLIALLAERSLTSPMWQFKTFFDCYTKLFHKIKFSDDTASPWFQCGAFLALPVLVSYLVFEIFDDGFIHFLLSTFVLIVCFGCFNTRDRYKQYLMSAFRGELTTCEMHHEQLKQDKNLNNMGFGQILVWLNYRYFIAIMIFFILFGATGALFYRLLTTVIERGLHAENLENEINNAEEGEELVITPTLIVGDKKLDKFFKKIINVIDWILVRIVALGYMFVGHFSKALPVWVEHIVSFDKSPKRVLIEVAEKSEDFMVDTEDCTAEPCLLVRLAKRTSLLCLSVLSILILTGVIN